LKESEVIQLAKNCGFPSIKAKALKLEASGREYFRLHIAPDESKVLCYLSPEKGNHNKFLHISNFFFNEKIKSPEIFYSNSDEGVTIQEDLGDKCLIDLDMLSVSNKEMLKDSIALLAKIQTANIPQIPKLELDDLNDQMNKLTDVFLKDFLGITFDNDFNELQDEVIKKLSEQPWMNCHFDFERRNLIALDNEIAVIDFQDLSSGPIGIDLAGLIIDHYIKYPDDTIANCLDHYSDLMEFQLDSGDIFEWIRWGAIQRNMRILGTLSSLYLDNKRTFRLKDLPMILSNLINLIPEKYESLKSYLSKEVQPQLLKKLSQI
jgi:aminoglycoside/choline kinase family phosphotransferase